MSETLQIDLLINNRDVVGKSYKEIRDPGRLTEIVAKVAEGDAGQVNEAVEAAHQAYQAWRQTDLNERIERLYSAAEALEEIKRELSVLLVREQGMLLRDTSRDVSNGIRTLRQMADLARDFLKPEQLEDEESWISIEKVPRGVVAAIVPWNAPMGLTMGKLAPAVVTGNTIVVKPSPFSPIAVTTALKKIASFFPPGVINVVHGEGEVGPTLTRHPLVMKIAFTGGTATGRQVMADAAATIKNIGLELGGNDPAIVLDDADISSVIPKLVRAVFPRSGQVCYAVKRIYVPQSMYDQFFDQFCQAVDELKVGYGLDETATLAPLNNANQFRRVRDLIERIKQTAEVRVLGQKLEPEQWENGYYMLPAVVRHPDPVSEIVTCEQFGPLVPIISYSSEEQVIQMANNTEFGLCSSIWSNDADRALRIARQIEAGVTFINSHSRTSLGDNIIPFGGVKQSGIGRERSVVGLAEYIEYHAISRVKK